MNKPSCVLLFSGGRDSSISAIRLAEQYDLTLLTITTPHLVGLEKVKTRLAEIRTRLSKDIRWIHLVQREEPAGAGLLATTCLPCHKDYISAGVLFAQSVKSQNLAIGYAGYQSSWPEQTMYATDSLREFLKRLGINLVLPAYNLQSREEAIDELAKVGLAGEAFEQKCLVQLKNKPLEENALKEQIDKWIQLLRLSITSLSSKPFEVVNDMQITLPSHQ
jgi:hypothetical protein